jgi:hypothetical protein
MMEIKFFILIIIIIDALIGMNTKKINRGIIYLLSLLIIIMSVFVYYYLLSVDEKYSRIIEHEGMLYNNTQNITFGANRGYLLLYKIMEANSDADRDSLIAEKNFLVAKNDSLIDDILFNTDDFRDKSHLNKVISTREEYVKSCGVFLEVLSDDKDSAKSILINIIEPNFGKYQEELKSFISSNISNVLQKSDKISSDIRSKTLFVISPVLIFTIFLILLGLFIIFIIMEVKFFPKKDHFFENQDG